MDQLSNQFGNINLNARRQNPMANPQTATAYNSWHNLPQYMNNMSLGQGGKKRKTKRTRSRSIRKYKGKRSNRTHRHRR